MKKQNTIRAEVMRRHIEDCHASKQKVIAYCKAHNITLSNCYYWKKRLDSAPAKPAFTQVSPMAVGATAVTIWYPNGVRIELDSNINTSILKELAFAKAKCWQPTLYTFS